MNYTAFCATTLVLISNVTRATDEQVAAQPPDLTHLSLEELMNVEVTSVSKRAEKLLEAPAAVSVVTADDIRRMGVTSIPESLRLVPGMQVARVDSHNWAISSRGFNDIFANKLLVLMDGRSVYTPLFSGVYWDVQDTMLEDLDRIETELHSKIAAHRLNYAIKRTIDVVGSFILIVLLSPVFLITALAVKLTSPGPVMYAHKRWAMGQKKFICLKFRSMRIDQDKVLDIAELQKMQQNGILLKLK